MPGRRRTTEQTAIPILQLRKLRLSEQKDLARGARYRISSGAGSRAPSTALRRVLDAPGNTACFRRAPVPGPRGRWVSALGGGLGG